jgi:RalA-binding protein 1
VEKGKTESVSHNAVAANPLIQKPVFGVPLQDAIAAHRIRDGLELPAVVFRCVEYLEAKAAEKEEGIYRLSGSSNVIRTLKDKFNSGKSPD